MKYTLPLGVCLGALFLFASGADAQSKELATIPCPSLTLLEWTSDTTFMAYLNPAQAYKLSDDRTFCLPTDTVGDVIGSPQEACVTHTPYTSEDMISAWVGALDQIVSNPELVEDQPVTPTVFRESKPGGSDCASLPRVGFKPKYGAIIIQKEDGAIFAAPISRKTYSAIKNMSRK